MKFGVYEDDDDNKWNNAVNRSVASSLGSYDDK